LKQSETEFAQAEQLRITYARHAHALLRLNWQDAEDEVQDAFCQAWQHRDECTGDLTHWLWRIVARECYMRLRELREQACDPEILARLAVNGETPESEYRMLEVRRILFHAVARLPEIYRLAAQMRFLDGMPVSAIAASLGLGYSTARTRAQRGYRELRRRIRAAEGKII